MGREAIRQSLANAQEVQGQHTSEAGPCPVVPLGHLDGKFYILDAVGQLRALSARQMGTRDELMALFLDEGMWLTAAFPCKRQQKTTEADGSESTRWEVVDFVKNKASAWLMAECRAAGLFGDHILIRKPGVWPSLEGAPVVHCGDAVLGLAKRHKPAGTRHGNQIWAAAPPAPRPGDPCSAAVGEELEAKIGRLWNFRRAGGQVVLVGLLGCAYFGASIPWRPAGFIIGAAGSGKSSIMAVLSAACPMHFYTNDTTKAGLEQSLDGRAMPTYVDEAADREDQRGARALLDLVLSAAGGEGTKGSRGGKEGKARQIEVAGSILMASISPPDMQAQHLGRFTIVDLDKAHEGVDYHNEHKELQDWARQHGAGLWARALAGWKEWRGAFAAFRDALKVCGCAPREMDQLGALLAGWWVLTHDGVPEALEADRGIEIISDYIRDSDDVLIQDSSARMINHLFSQLVQVQRSTDRRSLAELVRTVLKKPVYNEENIDGLTRVIASEVLANYGIRVIQADDLSKDRRGRSAPRAADGLGLWFWPGSSPLRSLFRDTPYSGQKFEYELRRLESARPFKGQIRIGAVKARGCIWVSGEELGFGDEADDG